MIRELDLQSLWDLFLPFPPIGQIKKWKNELEAAIGMVEPPEPGCIGRIVPAEPIKKIRQSMPELLRLQEELFDYMQLLRVAPTEAFAHPKSSHVNNATPDSAEGKKPLSPRESSQGRHASSSRSGPTDLGKPDVERWLTVTKAATVANTTRGTISRAVDGGRLRSNGQNGRARRIDAVDLARWTLERANRPEPESEDQVKRQMRKAGFQDLG
jgi:hypothetical protein